MKLWPFKYMPVYEERCPECGQHKLRMPTGNYCAYAMCKEGAKNHEAAHD